MTPEQKARVSIDALLVQAGWHVCDVADANIHAATGVAIREFTLNTSFGFADYLLYPRVNAAVVIEAEREGSLLTSRQRWLLTKVVASDDYAQNRAVQASARWLR